jgi:hypothetical protein
MKTRTVDGLYKSMFREEHGLTVAIYESKITNIYQSDHCKMVDGKYISNVDRYCQTVLFNKRQFV